VQLLLVDAPAAVGVEELEDLPDLRRLRVGERRPPVVGRRQRVGQRRRRGADRGVPFEAAGEVAHDEGPVEDRLLAGDRFSVCGIVLPGRLKIGEGGVGVRGIDQCQTGVWLPSRVLLDTAVT
jgi:hypothetical protein